MSPVEFRETIELLGYSQVSISRLFGVNDRTGRRWAAGDQEVPTAVEVCLGLMVREGLTSAVMAKIIAGRVGREFGEVDPVYHQWVLPRGSSKIAWTVARVDRDGARYWLPGLAASFSLDELQLGPRVHMENAA